MVNLAILGGSKFFRLFEQQTLFDRLDRDPNRQWGFSGNISSGGNAHNRELLEGYLFPYGRCPSSPLPAFSWPNSLAFGPTYTGVSGAYDASTSVQINTSMGYLSTNGALTRLTPISLAAIRDGATQTMVVAEQSDFCLDAGGSRQDCRSDARHGFQMGAAPGLRSYNVTTVLHRINEKSFNAVGVGMSFNHGANRPVQSAHSGGAQVCLADGSVHFLSESIDIQILYNLADRADGNVVTLQ